MSFDELTVATVLDHMNTEHERDVLVIVRGCGASRAVRAELVDIDPFVALFVVLDDDGLHYELEVPWVTAPLFERREIGGALAQLFDHAKGVR